MGNQASALGDEPGQAIAQKNLQHFDHSFKAELHTIDGPVLTDVFGPCKFAKRPCTVLCKGHSMEIIEEQGLATRKQAEIDYTTISGISWDHSNSEIKLVFHWEEVENFVILTLANSVEFEGELKLRLNGMAAQNRNFKVPHAMYIGMFAGSTKPKPFQRKRPNISHLPAAKLPPLHEMRSNGIDLHKGSYRPCPPGESRRIAIALQHIYEGQNTFMLMNVRGEPSVANQFRSESVLIICDDSLIFKPRGPHSEIKIEFAFDDIVEWNAIDNELHRANDSGIEIISANGNSVYFGVAFIRDVKHTFEYFWNTYKTTNGGKVKLGSTHGRPIVSVYTLSGEVPPPEPATGQSDVIDQDGILVRPGGKIAPRRASITAGVMTTKENKIVPSENKEVKKHWHKVVLHQGWLLKQGGVGVGTSKAWIKRYFVLYATSQGHFLVYYSDFTECPMYTTEKNHRNIVDLAACTFIRPGSNKADNPETPPYCFDIVTIEREWTLCAETQDNAQKWLKLLTRSVDEDVAILPDEELLFYVKPKVDPLNVLPATDYSTKLKISAQGISVCTPDPNAKHPDNAEREHYFWVYTDFYKWSLLSQAGKLALLVNVFADSSFSRRYEYIFRHKEAQRLATAIEYFIEKFMTVQHVSLEVVEGAFDEPADTGRPGSPGKAVSSGLHQLNPEDDAYHADEVQELDLLGLEVAPPSPVPQQRQQQQNGKPALGGGFSDDDPFGDDPFGGGSAAPAHTAAPAAAAGGGATDLFGDDPFGSDPFGAAPAAPSAGHGPGGMNKTAPPLSPQQIAQHRTFLLNTIANNGGPIYDDGTLQISCKIEIRGSQCRFTFLYRNQSPANLTDFSLKVNDPSGLMRFEMPPCQPTLSGLAQGTQVMMLECIKPTAPGPTLTVAYHDSLMGKRNNTLDLPIIVTSFNEPLNLSADDFKSRWQALSGPGQEAVEILKPSHPVIPQQIQAALVSTLKFGRVNGLPDASEFVIYGAASLRTGAMTPTGEKINVGCLVKIEMNVQANAMRVTLRAVHPAGTTAILQTAKSLLA